MNNIFKTPKWVKDLVWNKREYDENYLQELAERLAGFREDKPDVSIVIPVWNEGSNVLRTLDSISRTRTALKCELIVVNNNSTDNTQEVLDKLGIYSIFEPRQGIAFARQRGLDSAKGKYHLCADADTLYPPKWVDTMVTSLDEVDTVCVYGRYSFIPSFGYSRITLGLYEMLASVMIRFRKRKREFVNVLGFNFGFVTGYGKMSHGFEMEKPRVFENNEGSTDYVSASEDGMMALKLKDIGRIKMTKSYDARVWTMPRRLMKDGSLLRAVVKRIGFHGRRVTEYGFGIKLSN